MCVLMYLLFVLHFADTARPSFSGLLIKYVENRFVCHLKVYLHGKCVYVCLEPHRPLSRLQGYWFLKKIDKKK